MNKTEHTQSKNIMRRILRLFKNYCFRNCFEISFLAV